MPTDQGLYYSGRTTRIAINVIQSMLLSPGVKHQIVDHFDDGRGHASKLLAENICRVLECLGVRYTQEQTPTSTFFITVLPIRNIV